METVGIFVGKLVGKNVEGAWVGIDIEGDKVGNVVEGGGRYLQTHLNVE